MSWINLERLLLDDHPDRPVSLAPALDQTAVRARALSFAAALQAQGVQRLALYLDDAAELAVALG